MISFSLRAFSSPVLSLPWHRIFTLLLLNIPSWASFSRSHFPPLRVLTVTQLASQEAWCQCANLPLSLSFNKGSSVVKLVQENSPQVKKDELTAPSGKSAVKLPEVSVTVIIIQTNLNITVINDHYHPNQSYHHHCLYHQWSMTNIIFFIIKDHYHPDQSYHHLFRSRSQVLCCATLGTLEEFTSSATSGSQLI